MTLQDLIETARQHVSARPANEPSARLCLRDAELVAARGDTRYARERALKSLSYSLGILHPVYRAASGR